MKASQEFIDVDIMALNTERLTWYPLDTTGDKPSKRSVTLQRCCQTQAMTKLLFSVAAAMGGMITVSVFWTHASGSGLCP
jgi:hypothetical protein